MVHSGKMHGFMRMYWAKKILEVREALTAVTLKVHFGKMKGLFACTGPRRSWSWAPTASSVCWRSLDWLGLLLAESGDCLGAIYGICAGPSRSWGWFAQWSAGFDSAASKHPACGNAARSLRAARLAPTSAALSCQLLQWTVSNVMSISYSHPPLPQWTASPEEALEVAIWLNDKCECSCSLFCCRCFSVCIPEALWLNDKCECSSFLFSWSC